MYSSKSEIEETLNKLTKSDKDILIEKLEDIISKLPLEISSLIENAFTYKRVPKEYLLSAILFTFSTVIGKTFFINALGYKNYANLYFTIIGSRGDVKSEAIKIAIYPLKKSDDKDYQQYLFDNKNRTKEDDEVKRKQVLIQNATIESAYQVHYENPNSIGICMDEIFSLVEKMGNSSSRDGVEWRKFFLEGYTNDLLDISRKTTLSFRISESYPTLIGGLQHQFVKELFANGNLESGFIDRILFTTKLTENRKLRSEGIPKETEEAYYKSIQNVLDYKRQSENPEETKKQFQILFTDKAEKKLFEYSQKLINNQKEAKPILSEYISKMLISIHKFCLLSFIMKNAQEKTFKTEITLESVEMAIALNDFYYLNFQVIIKDNLKSKDAEITTESIIALAKKNNASQKAVAEVTGLHKSTISRNW